MPIAKFANECALGYNKKIAIDITSNGYLLDKSKILELKKLGLSSCQITLDGNKEHHNKIRFVDKGGDSYDIIINNVINAVRCGIKIVLRINYTKDNLYDLDLILEDLGVLTKRERSLITLSMNKVWQENCSQLNDIVEKFENKAADFGLIIPDALLLDHVHNACYADKTNEAVVNFDGNIYKCNARDFTIKRSEGRLNSDGQIIWNTLHKSRERQRFINFPCKTCSIFPVCGGGCSQVALENAGRDYCVGKDSLDKMIVNMFLSKNCKEIK